VPVGPEDTHPVRSEQFKSPGMRVPEPVRVADADERISRVPHLQRLGGQPVDRAVVWHLEHLDLAQPSGLMHPTLRLRLSVSGQHHVELAT